MKKIMPRLEIRVGQIKKNSEILSKIYGKKNISIMGVSKGVLGEPKIVEAMIDGGVKYIADSRIENIIKMREAGLITEYVLLRTMVSQIEQVIKYADISFNTEIETLSKLSSCAKQKKVIHRVVIMVELGDLREGVMPEDISPFIKETLALDNISVVGIGCNLACYGGVVPDTHNMNKLSEIAKELEVEYSIKLGLISGGNSANYNWYSSSCDVGLVNNVRLGESILLGREPLLREKIPELHTEIFKLYAEVIEAKLKPSLPSGSIAQNSYGETPFFEDVGLHRRVIVAIGRQDVVVSSLIVEEGFVILGSSSDHIIVEDIKSRLQVGDELKFDLDYAGMVSAMTSPFVQKVLL